MISNHFCSLRCLWTVISILLMEQNDSVLVKKELNLMGIFRFVWTKWVWHRHLQNCMMYIIDFFFFSRNIKQQIDKLASNGFFFFDTPSMNRNCLLVFIEKQKEKWNHKNNKAYIRTSYRYLHFFFSSLNFISPMSVIFNNTSGYLGPRLLEQAFMG